jgi:hypothetical protein
MSLAYRSLDPLAIARLRAAAGSTPYARLLAARRVYARRVARASGGLVGLGAGIALFASALWQMSSNGLVASGDPLTLLLFRGWEAAALAYVAGWIAGRIRIARAVARAPSPAEDDAHALATLEASTPARIVERLASRLETASVALPMMAISFLAPLTIHYLVGRLLGLFQPGRYDGWIEMSAVIVGHAHVGLAVSCLLFARRARRLDVGALAERANTDWLVALGVATLCGVIPGVLLIAVPPVLVLVTGLAFVPAMFAVMRRRIGSERAAMAELYQRVV